MTSDPATDHRAPVVLIPGFSGDPGRDFRLIAPMLARHRSVQTVDLRHVRDAAGLDAAVAAAVRIATTDLGARPILVGVSIGGTAAMRFATTRGDLLERVVAIAAWLQPPTSLTGFADIWSALRAERSPTVQAVARALLTSPSARDRWRSLPESVVTDTLISIAAGLDAGDAARLGAPALVIGGDADAVATTRSGRLLAASAGAEFRSVPGGHELLLERPVEVLSHITAFASLQPAAGRAADAARETASP